MIREIAVCVLILPAMLLAGQTNLVHNPSLEDTLCCPLIGTEIHCAVGWYQPNPAGSSSDYFHPCNIAFYNQYVSSGRLMYPRTGQSHALFITLTSYPNNPTSHFREYICGTLLQPLKVGSSYCVKFYVAPAWWLATEYTRYGADRVGIWFSSDSIIATTNAFDVIPLAPHIEYIGGVICDSLQWIEISGSYIAQGGELHFVIGNFYEDLLTNTIVCNPGSPHPFGFFTALLIDDVSVWPCDATVYEADAGNNKHICFGDEVTLGQNLPDDEYRFLWSAQSHRLTPKDQWDTLSTTHYLSVKPNQTTTYYLWVRDFKMDVTYDSVTVYVDPCLTPPVIPNVFTPNGDGFNDVFTFKNHEGWELETCIRSRWGQVVFEGKNDHWWDGTINGQQASPGVYYYTVTARNHFGQHEAFHGVVTLLR
jgi:gliding motility-associated-like protein